MTSHSWDLAQPIDLDGPQGPRLHSRPNRSVPPSRRARISPTVSRYGRARKVNKCRHLQRRTTFKCCRTALPPTRRSGRWRRSRATDLLKSIKSLAIFEQSTGGSPAPLVPRSELRVQSAIGRREQYIMCARHAAPATGVPWLRSIRATNSASS
jgi:hypothetical protein